MYQRVYVKFLDTVNKREYVRVCSRKPRCKPMNTLRYAKTLRYANWRKSTTSLFTKVTVVCPGAQECSGENSAGLDSHTFLSHPKSKATAQTGQAQSRASAQEEEEVEGRVYCFGIICRRRWWGGFLTSLGEASLNTVAVRISSQFHRPDFRSLTYTYF